jgi:hypothetical protein
MDEEERLVLLLLGTLLVVKFLQQAVALLRPVRVPQRNAAACAADPVAAARDEAEYALYAKDGKPPGWKRLRLTLALGVAVLLCTPPWWRLTRVRPWPDNSVGVCPGAEC